MTTRKKPTREEIDRDYWACACVKRDKGGNLSHIKLNHKSMAKCRTCGALRYPEKLSEWPKNSEADNA